MPLYRSALPQLDYGFFLTDGGAETTFVFLDQLELPDFAAYHLLKLPAGRDALWRSFSSYARLANRHDAGLILESATWRASADWGHRQGDSAAALADFNRAAIELLLPIRDQFAMPRTPIVISGCLGPRGDGYVPSNAMTVDEAEAYHRTQIETFADTAADMVCAMTMNYVDEALGIARAAKRAGMPVAISFTVETDGRLPTGQALQAAIEVVDAATSDYPCYYMINCAHPSHFAELLHGNHPWQRRIRGIRANASPKSHAELNDSTELDIGDPAQLGRDYVELKRRQPQLNVLGGCCGTDQRHVEQIALACRPLFPQS